MTPPKCAACHRKALAGKRYCVHHSQAYDGLMNHYRAWVDAYGKISIELFMDRLLSMKETGTWVKEVISAERATTSL